MLSVNPGCMWLCVAHAVCRVSALLFKKRKQSSCHAVVLSASAMSTGQIMVLLQRGIGNHQAIALILEDCICTSFMCMDCRRLRLYCFIDCVCMFAFFTCRCRGNKFHMPYVFVRFMVSAAGSAKRHRSTAKQCITYQMINWHKIELRN